MPKVSVIMGVYNSQDEYMLSRAIESILNQDFSDFEFIICNDCSTKGFVNEVLNKYKEQDKRILILQNDYNMGLAASLNKCLKVAKGEYIARQDDDDISLPNRIRVQVEYLDNNLDVPFVSCNLLLVNNKEIWGKHILKERPTLNDLMHGTVYAHPALLMRKLVYDKVGYYTVEDITRRTEDYDLYFKLAKIGQFGVNIQEFLFIYYQAQETYNKQKFKHKIDELRLKNRWFMSLKLYPHGYYYLLKSLISGLCPRFIKAKQKLRKYSLNSEEFLQYNNKFNDFI